MRKLFFLFLLLASLGGEALATDLRCQGDLMTPGTSIIKVQRKCGEPQWADHIGEIKVSSREGEERTLYITEMMYTSGTGYFVLTFEGSELKKTEYFPN
jgi:hypothetical protein